MRTVDFSYTISEERLRTYAAVPDIERLRWLDELVRFTMMWRAAARVGSPNVPRKAALLGLAGALSFGASDTLLAVNRFADPVPGAGWLVIVLYWLGQWGIAGSVVVAAARAELR